MSWKISPVPGPFSLKDQAYRAIKDAILNLELKPGDPLVESELAEHLRISKTPVRDALMDLEREGLVTRVPFRGTYVSEITTRDICELFQIRGVLEGLAARLVTPLLTESDLQKAEALINAQEEAVKKGDSELASESSKEFHVMIIQKTDNRRLVTILSNFDDQLQRFRKLSGELRGRSAKSAEEHRQVFFALREGDAEKAEQAIRKHLLSVLEDLSREGLQEVTAVSNSKVRSV